MITKSNTKSLDINVPVLNEHLDSFMRDFDRDGNTLTVYKKAISYFLEWADDMNITPPIIKTYKSYLLNSGLKPNTVSLYLTALKQYFSFLVERSVILYNPAKEVKRPRIPREHQRDALNAEQARHLLDSIDKSSLRGLRDFAMVNLMLRTGVREVEVSRMRIGDITVKEGNRILELHGKGRDAKDSFVLLTEEAFSPLHEYLAQREDATPETPLFESVGNRSKGSLSTRAIRKLITKHLEDAGLKTKRITPHSLRHTAITLAIAGGNGNNLLQVQQMARHTNISTTMGYFHEFNRLKNAAENCIQF